MRIFRLVIAITLLSTPALAQKINMMRDNPVKSQDQIDREKAVEEAYKAKMDSIPDQKGSSDPWATVRSAPATGPQTHKANRK
jgi:hypothetical protein